MCYAGACYHALGYHKSAVRDYNAAQSVRLEGGAQSGGSPDSRQQQSLAFYQRELAQYVHARLDWNLTTYFLDKDISPVFKGATRAQPPPHPPPPPPASAPADPRPLGLPPVPCQLLPCNPVHPFLMRTTLTRTTPVSRNYALLGFAGITAARGLIESAFGSAAGSHLDAWGHTACESGMRIL